MKPIVGQFFCKVLLYQAIRGVYDEILLKQVVGTRNPARVISTDVEAAREVVNMLRGGETSRMAVYDVLYRRHGRNDCIV